MNPEYAIAIELFQGPRSELLPLFQQADETFGGRDTPTTLAD